MSQKIQSILKVLKVSKFVTDNKITEQIGKATLGKGNIYTEQKSKIAYLPKKSYYNILTGSIITANNQTRYVLSKDDQNNSVVLNEKVNWYNLGKGFQFKYYNPTSKVLDHGHEVVGYITRNGLIYFSTELESLKLNQIVAYDSTGIKILNQNNTGLFIDNDGIIYRGSDETTWEVVATVGETAWGYIDGNISHQSDLMSLLNQKTDKPTQFNIGNFPMFDTNGNLIDSERSPDDIIEITNIDGGSF